MLSSDPIDEPTDEPLPLNPAAATHLRRRLILIALAVLTVLLLLFLPPYITANRFQRRIATNIGASLGRPVHFGRVSLTLLPLPGFTLENFVVEEDPAFGFEPILRAGEVRATLRISSLWGPRVEFSRISLTDPSVNLVHTADGRWNLEPVLFSASRIEAAPTAQLRAGPAPRFPYIEATGARVNLKLDQEKTPFSLTDADFALWLPQPHQWHLRLEAHPSRTDTAPGDSGTLRLEGVLGKAGTRAASLAEVPIDLHGDWQEAQLGGLTRLLLGRDAGLRGELAVNFSLTGALGHAAIATSFKVDRARRADFVPPHLLSLEVACQANASDTFHAFTGIECHWPPASSSDPTVLIATGSVPDVRHPNLTSAALTLPALPAATLLDWLDAATPHPPTGLQSTGTLAGTLDWKPPAVSSIPAQSAWSGELEFSGGAIEIDPPDHRSIPLGDILLRSTPPPAKPAPHSHPPPQPIAWDPGFDLLPIALPLGGKQPATLEGHFDATGYTLHLTGTVTAAEATGLAHAIPQFGEGLDSVLLQTPDATPAPCPRGTPGCAAAPTPSTSPIRVDLTAIRTWGGPQTWHTSSPSPTHPAATSKKLSSP